MRSRRSLLPLGYVLVDQDPQSLAGGLAEGLERVGLSAVDLDAHGDVPGGGVVDGHSSILIPVTTPQLSHRVTPAYGLVVVLVCLQGSSAISPGVPLRS